ncbi:hypothetical protein [Lutimonas zeaxanthinifaciens]|uniref:hypothetical protein n=1 Tax=Lutimonas zeaxanthinifaciens TaxID=3060215 RepID=UPI00265CBC6D|nr:hypothetical protein [Lutimonas sp. YSD2104]WKK64976.1 hypothetical protein QZH61_10325 [Lutimonas sp. YSD2104]
MRSKLNQRISTFEELNLAKKKLSVRIKEQEEEILSNPIISIPSAILQGGSFKSSFKTSMESISLDHYKAAALSLLSSVLMANKKTRKFFVAFIIAKEMVPFLLQKINEYVKK